MLPNEGCGHHYVIQAINIVKGCVTETEKYEKVEVVQNFGENAVQLTGWRGFKNC